MYTYKSIYIYVYMYVYLHINGYATVANTNAVVRFEVDFCMTFAFGCGTSLSGTEKEQFCFGKPDSAWLSLGRQYLDYQNMGI